jgi:hypothetical protein
VHRAQACAGERGRFAGYRLHQAANATVRLTEAHTYEHLVADANSTPNLPERMTAGSTAGKTAGLLTSLRWIFTPATDCSCASTD